jgi:hypothetical protein
VKNISSHLRVSRGLVLAARYEVLSRFENLPWRQRAKAVRMLVELLAPLPMKMDEAAKKHKPYSQSQID